MPDASLPDSSLPDAPLPQPTSLAALRGLRSAPALDGEVRAALRRELEAAVAGCEWFTIGVMAPQAASAVAALRACERACGWTPLQGADPASAPEADGPVFLKGNQRNGTYLLRREPGLGEGVLLTGHSLADPEAEDTWGPLPLDFFG